MTWMKPGITIQCWDNFYNHRSGPIGIIMSIDGPCTCTHIVTQINQRGHRTLPEHYHLECQPLNGKRNEDTKYWYHYINANGKELGNRWELQKVDTEKRDFIEQQLEMVF